MIKVVQEGSRTGPLLLCDICGQRIDNLGMGAAVFPRDIADGAQADVLHVHKRECHTAAEAKIGGAKGAPWQELQDHFIYLLANAGKPIGALVDRAKQLDQFEI